MYKFTRTPDPSNDADHTTVNIRVNNDDVTYHTLIEEFERFLKACGFVFNGHIEMVDLEENE
jgi:hypothetical protein